MANMPPRKYLFFNRNYSSQDIMTYHQNYYREHHEKRMVESQNYREENSERLNKNRREKIECWICNQDISRGSKSVHYKSKKHNQNIKNRFISIVHKDIDERKFIEDEYVSQLKDLLPKIYKEEKRVSKILDRELNRYENFDFHEAFEIFDKKIVYTEPERNILFTLGHLETIKARHKTFKIFYKSGKISKYLYKKWKEFYNILPFNNDRVHKMLYDEKSKERGIIFTCI